MLSDRKLMNDIITSVRRYIDENRRPDGVLPYNGRHCRTCRCACVKDPHMPVGLIRPYRPETPPNEEGDGDDRRGGHDDDEEESPPASPDGSADANDDLIFISDDEDAAERRDEALREEALGEPSSPLGFWRTILFNSPENMPDYSPRSTDSPDPTPVARSPSPEVARSPSPEVAPSPSLENNSASRKRRLYRSCRPRIYRFADTSSDDEEDGERPPTRRRSGSKAERPSRNRTSDGAGHSSWN
ncbi:hypothetical protein J6590_092684 [Homalodisca vitripennis]|nr:hypothetical protein J6590_092684 [Homalodisca vitripennis]